MSKIQSGQTQLPLLRGLCMIDLCTQHQQGGGQATKPRSSPAPQSTPPSPHLRNQPACSGNNKGTCLFVPPVLQLSPSKASPESPLSSYQLYWLKSPRTCLGNCLQSHTVINIFSSHQIQPFTGKAIEFPIQWPKMLVLTAHFIFGQIRYKVLPHIGLILLKFQSVWFLALSLGTE